MIFSYQGGINHEIYSAANPTASPADVKAALIVSGSNDRDSNQDPDGLKAPLLDVIGF